MRTRTMVMGSVLAVVAAVASTAWAAPADVDTILAKMKVALEPPKTSLRKLDITISDDKGDSSQWVAGQARKRVDGHNRILTVVLAPPSARGIALLVQEGDDKTSNLQWDYVPFVRRVRKLSPLHDYDAFLSSDFTYADLGFVDVRSKSTLVGLDDVAGKKTFRVETVPDDDWYYKRIVTWVDQSSMLPIQREFYGPANDAWKLEKFEDVTRINGIPSALKVTMLDQETKGKSSIVTSALRYDADLPDALFDPDRLSEAMESPAWGSLISAKP